MSSVIAQKAGEDLRVLDYGGWISGLEAMQRKLGVQSARIYVQCQNLFVITKYLGLDPETQGLNLPPLRMITAGLQIVL